MDRMPHEPTPVEPRWRRPALDPKQARSNLRRQYGLLGLWSVITVGWIVAVASNLLRFNWANAAILICGYLNLALGIGRIKRTAAGRKTH